MPAVYSRTTGEIKNAYTLSQCEALFRAIFKSHIERHPELLKAEKPNS